MKTDEVKIGDIVYYKWNDKYYRCGIVRRIEKVDSNKYKYWCHWSDKLYGFETTGPVTWIGNNSSFKLKLQND